MHMAGSFSEESQCFVQCYFNIGFVFFKIKIQDGGQGGISRDSSIKASGG